MLPVEFLSDSQASAYGPVHRRVQYVGRFLDDPLNGVPVELVEYLAEQLGVADPSCVKGRVHA